MALSRRDFVVGAGATVVLCSIGGVAYASPGPVGLIRPVGGQDESSFLATCLRCDRCQSVCPTDCIGVAHLEDGVIQMRTPKMDYHEGYCVFCNRCADVCTTGALHAIDPAVDKIGVAVVQPSQCVAWKNPGSCSKCEEACTYDAVHIEDSVPVVQADKCNGCGQCEYVCPALVYTSTSTTSERGIVVRTVEDYEKGAAK